MTRNILGTALSICSRDPMTGWLRDGCCNTDAHDRGSHVVCAVMTDAFLQFSKAQGNDLITPRPGHKFPGLKEGDRWCLCASRWKQAFDAGVAPPVVLEATHERATQMVSLEDLMRHAYAASLN